MEFREIKLFDLRKMWYPMIWWEDYKIAKFYFKQSNNNLDPIRILFVYDFSVLGGGWGVLYGWEVTFMIKHETKCSRNIEN